MMDLARRAQAASDALESEGAGVAYAWPERSCVSLIRALCEALDAPAPDHSDFLALSEGRAASLARKRHGSFGAAHQAVLSAAGWMAAGAVEPGCVVSIEGRVELSDLSVYEPRADGLEWTGIVGPDYMTWGWGPHGLATVRSAAEPAFITRYGAA